MFEQPDCGCKGCRAARKGEPKLVPTHSVNIDLACAAMQQCELTDVGGGQIRMKWTRPTWSVMIEVDRDGKMIASKEETTPSFVAREAVPPSGTVKQPCADGCRGQLIFMCDPPRCSVCGRVWGTPGTVQR